MAARHDCSGMRPTAQGYAYVPSALAPISLATL